MINVRKISRALKNKNVVRWIKKDYYNYIMTDYFILKTNRQIRGSALTALFKILKDIPQEGEGLECKHRIIKKLNSNGIKNSIELINIPNNYKRIGFTNLIYQLNKDLFFSIFTMFEADSYIYLDKIYTDLVNLREENIEILGRDKASPIYFTAKNESIMILPTIIKEKPMYIK